MRPTYISFALFAIILTQSTITMTVIRQTGPSLSATRNNLREVSSSLPGWYKRNGRGKQKCSKPKQNEVASCLERAQNVGELNDDANDDLDFFQKCIVEHYCFEKSPTADVWTRLPSFRGLVGTEYFNSMAKRVQMFFIRNNDWSRTMTRPLFRDVATGQCTNLLKIIAARYLYVTHVLNLLRDENTFGPCDVHKNKFEVPVSGICYPPPHGQTTCTSDYDVALIGARSGSLAALFNQFFRETLGREPLVAGFGKSSEELLNANVFAFTLEFAMPDSFSKMPHDVAVQMNAMKNDIYFIIQELVSAILKMKPYNNQYFNDLLSDQAEFSKRTTRHNLGTLFHDWVTKFTGLNTDIEVFKTSRLFTTEISFIRQHNMAYELLIGSFENHGISDFKAKALAEVSIVIAYMGEAYHTRGTVRHVVGWTQMRDQEVFNSMTVNDYWLSMLENWADAVKEYYRECAPHTLMITACLPKMAKHLWRMLDAMFAARSRITPTLRTDLLEVDNVQNTGLRSIMSHWLLEVKRKGLVAIPDDDRLPGISTGLTNLDYFLQAFGCIEQGKTQALSTVCLDHIHAVIRDYNRKLFITLINNDQ